MTYADFVSSAAAVMAAGSLLLHYLKWRSDQKSSELIVRAESGAVITDDIRAITVTLRSRSNIGYKVKTFRIAWPVGSRLMRAIDCFDYDSFGNSSFVPPMKPLKRQIPSSLEVAHSGERTVRSAHGGPVHRWGDTESETIFVKGRFGRAVWIGVEISPEDNPDRPFTRWKRVNFSA